MFLKSFYCCVELCHSRKVIEDLVTEVVIGIAFKLFGQTSHLFLLIAIILL